MLHPLIWLEYAGVLAWRLKLFTVQFDGVLQVIDADQTQHAIESGIGSGKGFGCGLLSLARA